MVLDLGTFQQQFTRFEARIRDHDGKPFASFHEGLPAKWEAYKVPLRSVARDRLGFGQWGPTQVGTGQILDKLVKAIEITDSPDVPSSAGKRVTVHKANPIAPFSPRATICLPNAILNNGVSISSVTQARVMMRSKPFSSWQVND